MKKLIKNTIIETYCVKHCCQDTPKRVVHAEGGAVSINTKIKSEDTEITDTRNHRHTTGEENIYFLYQGHSSLYGCAVYPCDIAVWL